MRAVAVTAVSVAMLLNQTLVRAQETAPVVHVFTGDLKLGSPWVSELRRILASGDTALLGKNATEFVKELEIAFVRGKQKALEQEKELKKNGAPTIQLDTTAADDKTPDQDVVFYQALDRSQYHS